MTYLLLFGYFIHLILASIGLFAILRFIHCLIPFSPVLCRSLHNVKCNTRFSTMTSQNGRTKDLNDTNIHTECVRKKYSKLAHWILYNIKHKSTLCTNRNFTSGLFYQFWFKINFNIVVHRSSDLSEQLRACQEIKETMLLLSLQRKISHRIFHLVSEHCEDISSWLVYQTFLINYCPIRLSTLCQHQRFLINCLLSATASIIKDFVVFWSSLPTL